MIRLRTLLAMPCMCLYRLTKQVWAPVAARAIFYYPSVPGWYTYIEEKAENQSIIYGLRKRTKS